VEQQDRSECGFGEEPEELFHEASKQNIAGAGDNTLFKCIEDEGIRG
jgi:hypothetical protein